MNCTIYVVEDHELVRHSLCQLLSTEPGVSVCGQAGNAEDAIAELGDKAPDVLLVDVSLPGMGGIDLIAHVSVRHPQIRCLIYSGYDDVSHVEQAIGAGARGYVLKDNPVELWDAIEVVMQGGRYMSRRP